jgi:hypothetical protein
MKIATIKKQPGEKRRYGITYKEALDELDEVISVTVVVEAVNSADPPALTASAITATPEIRFTIDGGTDNLTYKITLTVKTTSDNEIFEDEIFVKVKEV